MIDFRRLGSSKLPVFSTISLAAMFFLVILSFNLVSNLSIHSVIIGPKTIPHLQVETLLSRDKPPLRTAWTVKPLLSVQEEVGEAYPEDDHDHGPLVHPPFNVAAKERIARFNRTSPEFEILKSTRLSRQFDSRVREHLGHGCEVQFFMTWISPANSFRQREFVVVESLFKAHRHGCLTILSRTMDSERGYRVLKPLLDQGFRVLAVTPDLSSLFNNTPAESWLDDIKSGNKDPGEIPLAQNLSNLIRLAVLHKYGGVYIDTDFIVLKDFSGLRNSIGAQSMDVSGNWTRLNNAVLVFDKNHPLLYHFIKEFASTFDGNKWGHNGPYLVSRVVERVATRTEYNFTILPPMAFYPVDWIRIGGFFTKPINRANSKWVEAKLLQLRRGSYGVHLWNRESSKLRIEEGSLIGRLISDHCVICKYIYSS